MATLVCTVELDKTTGVVVTIADASGGVTQTIACNGKTLVMTVKDKKGISTYTQDGSRVVIQTDTFEVRADKAITLKSKGAVAITSGKGMTLSSRGKLTLSSSAGVAVKGNTVALTGKLSLEAKGGASQVALNAGSAKVSTPGSLKLEGKAMGDLKAAIVKVKANAILNLEAGGITTLKGALTNVKGALVNVG